MQLWPSDEEQGAESRGSISQFLQLSTPWEVRVPTRLSKREGHEVPGIVAALFIQVADSKYTCKRLRVYEATKMCEQPLVKR